MKLCRLLQLTSLLPQMPLVDWQALVAEIIKNAKNQYTTFIFSRLLLANAIFGITLPCGHSVGIARTA